MKKLKLLLATFIFLSGISLAGDLKDLPDNQAAFAEKVSQFIKPGQTIEEVMPLLKDGGFDCSNQADKQGPFLWCDRMDGGLLSLVKRRYQIVLQAKQQKITSVRASFGLIGP